jgi:uncharacterized protein YjbI with pentapeptide repeats
VVALLTIALLIVSLYSETWKHLLEKRNLKLIAIGVSLAAIIVLLAIGGAASRWTGFRGKTVWDLLQLLIVPLALAVIGLWFAAQQDARQQQIENQRADAERELADQRAQDEALQAYLSQMGSLLLDKNLRKSEEDSEVRTLARARTLTVLGRLDPSRKADVMEFLMEAELVQGVEGTGPIIELGGADLRDANLYYANLDGALLREADLRRANLFNANLSGANRRRAELFNADLSGAYLHEADLRGANLSGADLSGEESRTPGEADIPTVTYGANLSGANLSGANLSGANLSGTGVDLRNSGADLSDADLSDADLSDAKFSDADLRGARGVTNEELEQQAASLEGATMPNGQKYEEWLKDREKRQKDE